MEQTLTERKQLISKIKQKQEESELLQEEIKELIKQNCLLCDEKQWFEEKTEIIGRGKSKREMLIGRVHWYEDFKDGDTGNVITIRRNQVVRINGEWQ